MYMRIYKHSCIRTYILVYNKLPKQKLAALGK